MMKTKRTQVAAVILAVASLSAPTAHASGVAMVDVATFAQLKLRYDTLMETFKKAKEQYQAITGVYYGGKQNVDSTKENKRGQR